MYGERLPFYVFPINVCVCVCVYVHLKGNRVTQQEPQGYTDSPSRETEEDEIRDLNLTREGGRKRNRGEEDELHELLTVELVSLFCQKSFCLYSWFQVSEVDQLYLNI